VRRCRFAAGLDYARAAEETALRNSGSASELRVFSRSYSAPAKRVLLRFGVIGLNLSETFYNALDLDHVEEKLRLTSSVLGGLYR